MSVSTTELISELRWVAEQQKSKGSPIARALEDARRQNKIFEENECGSVPDGEIRLLVNEVYGAAQRAVISTSHEFARKEFKESEVLLRVKETKSPVLHHPSLGEIHAFRGVGKTNFGIGLFDALATGGEFLCYEATRPFRTIYFDGEMDASDLQESLGLLAEENGNFQLVARCEQPDNFMPSIATTEGLAWCEEAITRAGAEIAIFDNWSTLANIGTNEEEAFFEFSAWCRKMRLRGVTVIYDHHDGKSGTQRGHTKPEDCLNWVIGLTWPSGYKGQEQLKCVMEFEKCRKPVREFSKIAVQLEPDGTWCWGKDIDSAKPTTGRPLAAMSEEQIATMKQLIAEGKSERLIAEAVGISRAMVRRRKAELQGKKKPEQDQLFDEEKNHADRT